MATGVKLLVTRGPLTGRTFVFTDRTFCTVGRDSGCLLCLKTDPPDRSVSRRHCLFDVDPPDIRVPDLGSRNGTFVNGARIGGRDLTTGLVTPGVPLEVTLRDGDTVGIGATCFEVAVAEVPAAEEPLWAEVVEPEAALAGG